VKVKDLLSKILGSNILGLIAAGVGRKQIKMILIPLHLLGQQGRPSIL